MDKETVYEPHKISFHFLIPQFSLRILLFLCQHEPTWKQNGEKKTCQSCTNCYIGLVQRCSLDGDLLGSTMEKAFWPLVTKIDNTYAHDVDTKKLWRKRDYMYYQYYTHTYINIYIQTHIYMPMHVCTHTHKHLHMHSITLIMQYYESLTCARVTTEGGILSWIAFASTSGVVLAAANMASTLPLLPPSFCAPRPRFSHTYHKWERMW